MSNYLKQTRHPITLEWEDAEWIDNYYGGHRYGVRFKDDQVFNPEIYKMETRDHVEN